jgi:hypothetical protein
MLDTFRDEKETVLIEEVLVLLQLKRTSLKTIRMGIAVVVSQLSLAGFTMLRYRSRISAPLMAHWLNLLIAVNVTVLCFALYLIFSPLIRIRKANQKLRYFRAALCQIGSAEHERYRLPRE